MTAPTSPRRIGFDVSKAAAPRDGIGNFTFELLRALLAGSESGAEEWILFSPLQASDGEALKAELGPAAEGLPWHDRAPRPQDRLDLFHSTSWIYPAAVHCPVLFTCYDLTFLSHPQCHTFDNKVHCTRGLLQAHLAGAHFLAISQATAEALHQRLEVPKARIEVVYPAPAERFRPGDLDGAKQRLHERFSLDGDYLLAVGTVEPRKNLLRLLEAYGSLDEATRRSLPLVLAGGAGWHDAASLDDALARPELATVRRLGRVDDEWLVDLYRGATAFLYPSLAEGFGLPVVEAMACGTAVLTADVSATAEVAAGAALTVDPLDSVAIAAGIRHLLGDNDARGALQAAGTRRAGDFSWHKSAESTRNLYDRLIESS